jgi:hypothetical protein
MHIYEPNTPMWALLIAYLVCVIIFRGMYMTKPKGYYPELKRSGRWMMAWCVLLCVHDYIKAHHPAHSNSNIADMLEWARLGCITTYLVMFRLDMKRPPERPRKIFRPSARMTERARGDADAIASNPAALALDRHAERGQPPSSEEQAHAYL